LHYRIAKEFILKHGALPNSCVEVFKPACYRVDFSTLRSAYHSASKVCGYRQAGDTSMRAPFCPLHI